MDTKKKVTDKVLSVLEIWTHLAVNIRVRDRSIKIVQYGCTMLLSYYGKYLTKEGICTLSQLKRASSTSRKAFWLLKSFNHIGEIIRRCNWELIDPKGPVAEKLDFIEQIFLALYFYYENQIFLARTKFLNFCEDKIDPYCNWTWFGGDMAFFLSCLVRSWNCYVETREVEQSIRLSMQERSQVASSDPMSCNSSNSGSTEVCTNDSAGKDDNDADADGEARTHTQDSTTSLLIKSNVSGTVPVLPLPTALPVGTFSSPTSFPVDSQSQQLLLQQRQHLEKLLALNETRTSCNISLLIAWFEVAISANFVGVWKLLLAEPLNEGHVGLMGVLSSVLMIYDAYRNINK